MGDLYTDPLSGATFKPMEVHLELRPFVLGTVLSYNLLLVRHHSGGVVHRRIASLTEVDARDLMRASFPVRILEDVYWKDTSYVD